MIQMLVNCESFLQTWKNCLVVDTEAVKNTTFNTRMTKVNNLENRIRDATTLIDINQYNTDKKTDTSGLVPTTVLDTNISEVENKIPDHAKYIISQEVDKLNAETLLQD